MERSERKTRSLTLIVTERCDLSCVYCYEHNKSAAQMTFEAAKEIIDKEFRNLDTYDYTVEFFGGEPFLNFELIKQVVEYVVANYKEGYHFFATTNGTQVHGAIQDWLIEKKNIFTVGLSLDGNKTAHNINRCNSFEKIDLDFFVKNYPHQSVKMTISDLSLPYLAESIKFLTEYGFLISCNLAYMIDWFSPKNFSTLKEQLDLLIEYYLQNPDADRCTLMSLPIEILSHPQEDESTIRKYCGCGVEMRCYDKDKKCYPCQLFSRLSAGEKSICSEDFVISENLYVKNFPEKCKSCYYLRICQFCLGSNYLSTGNLYLPDESRCKLYQLTFKANAKLRALEWEKGICKIKDEQGLLRSILSISQLPDFF